MLEGRLDPAPHLGLAQGFHPRRPVPLLGLGLWPPVRAGCLDCGGHRPLVAIGRTAARGRPELDLGVTQFCEAVRELGACRVPTSRELRSGLVKSRSLTVFLLSELEGGRVTGQRDTVLRGRDLGFLAQGHVPFGVGFTSPALVYSCVTPVGSRRPPAAVAGSPPTPPPPRCFQDLAMYINEVKRDKETLKKISEFQSCIENLVSVADSPKRGD